MKKSKKNLYLVLIVCIYILGIVIGNIYIRNKYDTTLNNISAFVVYGKENHDDLFNSTDGVVSYERALSFYAGDNNDIIYTPVLIEDSKGSKYYKDGLDRTKINWNSLSNMDNNIILGYKASSCDSELSRDDVIIKLSSKDYDENYLDNFIGNIVTFKFNGKLVPLRIKDVIEPDVYSSICVADELYNELIIEEDNYIYDIEITDYRTYEELKYKWQDLEKNSFFELFVSTKFSTIELSNKVYKLGNFIKILNVVNIISSIIFILFMIGLLIKFLLNYIIKE